MFRGDVRIRNALLACGIVGTLAGSLNAASFIVPPDRRMVQDAPAIVIASALGSHTQLIANGGIETVTTMSVSEVLKGTIEGDPLDIHEPGGVYKDRAIIIPGTPRFKDGDRFLLFLIQSDDGHWHVLDLILGKFTFTTDVLGHDVLVRKEDRPASRT